MDGETYQYVGKLIANAACVWFAFWAIRSKYELDYKLNRAAQTLRWGVIVVAFSVALLRAPQFKAVRITAGIVFLAFLCWPNFAYHLTRLFWRSVRVDKDS